MGELNNVASFVSFDSFLLHSEQMAAPTTAQRTVSKASVGKKSNLS
jgi:hypothetical protein